MAKKKTVKCSCGEEELEKDFLADVNTGIVHSVKGCKQMGNWQDWLPKGKALRGE